MPPPGGNLRLTRQCSAWGKKYLEPAHPLLSYTGDMLSPEKYLEVATVYSYHYLPPILSFEQDQVTVSFTSFERTPAGRQEIRYEATFRKEGCAPGHLPYWHHLHTRRVYNLTLGQPL